MFLKFKLGIFTFLLFLSLSLSSQPRNMSSSTIFLPLIIVEIRVLTCWASFESFEYLQEEREVLILKSKLDTFTFLLLLNLEASVLRLFFFFSKSFKFIFLFVIFGIRIFYFRCLQEKGKLLIILKIQIGHVHVLFNAKGRVLSTLRLFFFSSQSFEFVNPSLFG